MRGIKVTFSRRVAGEGGKDQGSQIKVAGRFIFNLRDFGTCLKVEGKKLMEHIELDSEDRNICTC